jgi:hypothetical protein
MKWRDRQYREVEKSEYEGGILSVLVNSLYNLKYD